MFLEVQRRHRGHGGDEALAGRLAVAAAACRQLRDADPPLRAVRIGCRPVGLEPLVRRAHGAQIPVADNILEAGPSRL